MSTSNDNNAPQQTGGLSENDTNVDATIRHADQTEPSDVGSINAEPKNNLGGLLDENIERFNDGS